MRETLAHYNFAEPTVEQVRATIGLTLEASMHQLTEGRCEPLVPEMVKHYRALHTTKAAPLTHLFDGAIPTLAQLRARNIFTILVSNKGHRAGLHQLITQLEIANYIDIVLSAEDVNFHKPDARLYTEHIAALLPSDKTLQTLVVGDTETDILFAKNATLLSCWATYGYGDEQRCKALSPDFELHKLTDLPALIANFTK